MVLLPHRNGGIICEIHMPEPGSLLVCSVVPVLANLPSIPGSMVRVEQNQSRRESKRLPQSHAVPLGPSGHFFATRT